MRFHHLRVTAFGPYAGSEVVDFDELNDAGIFLLTGPTGAGKTSILDAICFALYGVVPGTREVRSLRSHHAAPGVRPEVELEVTLGHRRLRVVRSPEWRRPKKRGEGETRENAAARLVELTDGTERLVSSRIQEVGHELGLLLGMSSEQFRQVVLLPQGEFQTFLCATSDERQAVLQKLFQTHRFARIEEWVRAHSRDLGSRATTAEKRVCQLLGTVANRAGQPLPQPLADDRLGDVAELARRWLGNVVGRSDELLHEARRAEREAQSVAELADEAEREAVRGASALRRRREAEARLTALEETAGQVAEGQAALAAHDRAVQVRPFLHPLTELDESRDRAADEVTAALRRLREAGQPELAAPTDGVGAGHRTRCEELRREVSDRLARLRALLPREHALDETEAELAAARRELAGLREVAERTELRHRELPAERQQVTDELAGARGVAAALDTLRTARATLAARAEAAVALPAARERHTTLVDEVRQARDRVTEAREHHLDLVERRLTGMAAELAGQLADGEPCQVCGATEHPHKARPSADAVTQEEQEVARTAVARLRHAQQAVEDHLDEAARALEPLERLADALSPEEAARRSAEAEEAVAAAEAAAAALPALEARERELEAEGRELAELLDRALARVAKLEVDVRVLEATAATSRLDIADAAGAHPTVAAAIAALEQRASLLDRALAALEEHDLCDRAAADALARAQAAAEQQGFGSVTEAAAALLTEETEAELRAATATREEQRSAALAVLADDEVRRVAELDEIDVAAARAALEEARASWRRWCVKVASAEEAQAAVTVLVVELDDALAEWEPLRAEHSVADGMNRLVRGLGTDNQLQMRLSSYVLATRLDQVLEAANERLGHMRDQRYSLRREGRARGGARAGLGLELLDDWTGEARAPSTLSGGETFVVSLALALGLADVVQQESGGLRVDTLFIDEGFGMLDAETLDDVMDRIDALRAGGRTVGVVSHVTELRGRIPTQLHVTRTRTGSSVAVRTLIA
ncbi:MAG TPA: SMC family ATPase [Marmoricola sp.]|nr:SMC family ATPase [Marmoricola sp.]